MLYVFLLKLKQKVDIKVLRTNHFVVNANLFEILFNIVIAFSKELSCRLVLNVYKVIVHVIIQKYLILPMIAGNIFRVPYLPSLAPLLGLSPPIDFKF